MDEDVKKIMALIREWEQENAAMAPVPVPAGCRAEYVYAQPIIGRDRDPAGFPEHLSYEPQNDEWGILFIRTDREMNRNTEVNIRGLLARKGLTWIGALRLIRQNLCPEGALPQIGQEEYR